MKYYTMSVWVVGALAMMATPVWAQTSPPIQNGQVEIFKALPRTTSGVRLEDVNERDGNRADNRGGRGGSANSGSGSANSGSGRGGDNSGRGGRDDNRVTQVGDVRQEDRRADRRANTGGELRGLDRADHVTGGHGQQGRDNARVAQMERPNRPERPQRPERPEKAERGGRN